MWQLRSSRLVLHDAFRWSFRSTLLEAAAVRNSLPKLGDSYSRPSRRACNLIRMIGDVKPIGSFRDPVFRSKPYLGGGGGSGACIRVHGSVSQDSRTRTTNHVDS